MGGGYVKRWYEDRGEGGGLKLPEKGWRNLCTAPEESSIFFQVISNTSFILGVVFNVDAVFIVDVAFIFDDVFIFLGFLHF